VAQAKKVLLIGMTPASVTVDQSLEVNTVLLPL
jgi:hypothetical protein